MVLLFNYKQEKKEKYSNNSSNCELTLSKDVDMLILKLTFNTFYVFNTGEIKNILFLHTVQISLKTGDITNTYQILNNGVTTNVRLKNSEKTKKNDFNFLEQTIQNGIVRGEKRSGYWGVKYNKAIRELFDVLYFEFKQYFHTTYYQTKYEHNSLDKTCLFYELFVDFYLEKKKIRANNNVYTHIQKNPPKQKWLKKNDFKYIPSILDEHGIKCKYFVSKLNSEPTSIYVKNLSYLCGLFGENYVEYIKNFSWKSHCYVQTNVNNGHKLKTEEEKKCLIRLAKKWEESRIYSDSLLSAINKLLTLRVELENLGYKLKFNAKTDVEYDNLLLTWLSYKAHQKRGFKYRYVIDQELKNDIETPFVIEDSTYTPKILLSEDDFMIEGMIMKNCMGKQFIHGSIYLYIALVVNNKKRVNLQYRKGQLTQSYGKANTLIPNNYLPAINFLSEKFEKHENIIIKKESYDHIKK